MPNYITDNSLLSQLNTPDAPGKQTAAATPATAPAPAPAPVRASNPAEFASAYGDAAARAGAKLGVAPHVLLGQWGLETGWGKSVVPGTNNLGNIKDMSGTGVAATDNMTGSKDNYRTFATPNDFADHYADLVSRKYQGAVGAGSDAAKFAGALAAGGYAQDPRYAAKVTAAAGLANRASNPLLRAANAVTDAVMPSAQAATPARQYVQDPSVLAALNAPDQVAAAPGAQTPAGVTAPTPAIAQAGSAGDPTDGNSFLQNAAIGVGKAFTDIGQGVGQRLRGAIEAVAPAQRIASGAPGQSFADTLGLPTQADVDEKRRLDAPIMATGGGKIGNFVGNAAPGLAIGLVPGGQSLAGSMLAGGALGASAPTATGESVLGNTVAGIAGGGVGYGIGKGIARVVSPNASTNAELALLKSEGVQPTIGQTLGGAWNTVEQKLQSVPIMGDAITAARNNAKDQFNNAAINRATAPIGVKIQGSGQDAVRSAGDALSAAYDSALSKVQHVTLDQQFVSDMGQLQGMAQNLVPTMRKKFNSTVNDLVAGRVSPQGSMLGDTYKAIDSELGGIASKFSNSQVASESEYGDAISQLRNILKQQMMRSNPGVAAELNAADTGWANLTRVEGAAKIGKNNEGTFTPGQLNSAIQTADDSVRGRSIARGTALMQDLGNAGQTVLGNKYPDSGTAGRVMGGIGALATGALHPAIPAGLIGGAAAYTKPVQSLLTSAVSSRPSIAQPVGRAISRYASSLAPAGALTAVGGTRSKQKIAQ